MEIKISHSDVDSFNLCTRREYYGGRLGLRRKALSDSLTRGIMLHDIMESFFKGGMQESIGFQVLDELLTGPDGYNHLEIIAEVKRLYEFFLESEVYKGWEPIAVEKKYALDLSTPEDIDNGIQLIYPFTVDMVMKNQFDEVVLVDHKTTYRWYTDKQIDLNMQLPRYAVALTQLNYGITKCAYLQFRHRYRADADHTDVIRYEEFEPSMTRLNRGFEELQTTMRKIAYLRQQPLEVHDKHAVRTANNLVCNSCSYSELCIADLNGWDTGLLIKTGYEEAEDRYPDVEILK